MVYVILGKVFFFSFTWCIIWRFIHIIMCIRRLVLLLSHIPFCEYTMFTILYVNIQYLYMVIHSLLKRYQDSFQFEDMNKVSMNILGQVFLFVCLLSCLFACLLTHSLCGLHWNLGIKWVSHREYILIFFYKITTHFA